MKKKKLASALMTGISYHISNAKPQREPTNLDSTGRRAGENGPEGARGLLLLAGAGIGHGRGRSRHCGGGDGDRDGDRDGGGGGGDKARMEMETRVDEASEREKDDKSARAVQEIETGERRRGASGVVVGVRRKAGTRAKLALFWIDSFFFFFSFFLFFPFFSICQWQ